MVRYQLMRRGDVNGDGVADVIQRVNPDYDLYDMSTRRWSVRVGSPSVLGGGPGFDPSTKTIPFVDGVVDTRDPVPLPPLEMFRKPGAVRSRSDARRGCAVLVALLLLIAGMGAVARLTRHGARDTTTPAGAR